MKKIFLEMDERHLQERFEFLYVYKGIYLYDACHIKERLAERFPNMPFIKFINFLKLAMSTIDLKYNLEPNAYMIISKSTGLKFPIDLRKDRMSDKLIGVITTILDVKKHFYNTHKEVMIFVENSLKKSNKEIVEFYKQKSVNSYLQFDEIENDMLYQHVFENGNHFTTYQKIIFD